MIRLATAGAATLLALITACSSHESTDASAPPATPQRQQAEGSADKAPTSSEFRRYALYDAWEIEHFRSMRDLVTKADLVVIATVSGGHWGTQYRDAETDRSGRDVVVLQDVVLELDVDEVISGEPVGPRDGTIEMVVDLVDPRKEELDAPVGEQAILVLRRGGAPVPGVTQRTDSALLHQKIYRQVSSLGVVDVERSGLAFPLGGDADWAFDFLSLSWDEAIAELHSLAGD